MDTCKIVIDTIWIYVKLVVILGILQALSAFYVSLVIGTLLIHAKKVSILIGN